MELNIDIIILGRGEAEINISEKEAVRNYFRDFYPLDLQALSCFILLFSIFYVFLKKLINEKNCIFYTSCVSN